MHSTVRRGLTWSVLLIGTQALAMGAFAQSSQSTFSTSSATTSSSANRGDDTSMHGMDHKSAQMNVTPQSFASQAAVIGKAEIELGQLALQKSQDADVRAYAQRMVKDHTAADAKLKKIASKDNITLPTALDAEHKAVKQKLAGLQGEAFDREYKQQMEKGHEKAVALFQSASQAQQMPEDLKEFAASTLSTLEDHREQAQELDTKKDGA